MASDPTAEPANLVPHVDALQAALDLYIAGGGPPQLSAGEATTAAHVLVHSRPFAEPEPELDEPHVPIAATFVIPRSTVIPASTPVTDVEIITGDPGWDRRRRVLAGAIALLVVVGGLLAVRNPFASETNVHATVPPASATTLGFSTIPPVSSAPLAAAVAPPVSVSVTTTEPEPPPAAHPKTTAAPRPHTTAPAIEPPATSAPTDTVIDAPTVTDPPPTSSPPPTEPPTSAPAPPTSGPLLPTTVPSSSP